MHCIGLAGNRISQPAKKIPSARVSGSEILIVSSNTWRQVVKLVVIVKVILVVWLVIMVVGDRSKDILSTTVRRLGRAKCGNDVERERDGHKLYHFKGEISQAMMTFDVDIGA